MGAVRVTIDLENTTDADLALDRLKQPEAVRRFVSIGFLLQALTGCRCSDSGCRIGR
jgi:hypothetical protein